MPGYCVAGTVGHKILNGVRKLELENKQIVSYILSVHAWLFCRCDGKRTRAQADVF